MATAHLPIRQLVEFLLRTGSIDSRFTGLTVHWKVPTSTANCKKLPETAIRLRYFSP